jgi:yecA family protein
MPVVSSVHVAKDAFKDLRRRIFHQVNPMLLDYDFFNEQLSQADIDSSAAEIHGLLCGLLCGGEKDVEQRLLSELSATVGHDDAAWKECRQSLAGLVEETSDSLSGEQLGFPLLMPDDKEPLLNRATAARDWCQGFLYGMGLLGEIKEQSLSDEAREAMRDLAEITRMDLDGLGDGEEEESALMEVAEFIWVAATLIYDDLALK